MKKRALSLLLTGCLVLGGLTACGSKETPTTPNTQPEESKQTTTEKAPEVEPENLTEVQKIIKEAEGMTMEELAKKAIEESNGKTFYGVGNSSRGKTALPLCFSERFRCAYAQ